MVAPGVGYHLSSFRSGFLSKFKALRLLEGILEEILLGTFLLGASATTGLFSIVLRTIEAPVGVSGALVRLFLERVIDPWGGGEGIAPPTSGEVGEDWPDLEVREAEAGSESFFFVPFF